MPDARPTTKSAQTEETTRRLIDVARLHFTRQGYAGASTEMIVQEAGVTRGALYHHFDNKQGLFEAVLAAVQREVGERVALASRASAEPWDQLVAGCEAFLRACLEPDVRRILLIDGPAIIGWEAWRKMDAENAMRLLEEGLAELAEEQVIQVGSVRAATHLLSGAMNEAALWIASSDQPAEALDESLAVLAQLLGGLRGPAWVRMPPSG